MTPMSKIRELADAADAAADELAQAMADHYHEQSGQWKDSAEGKAFDDLTVAAVTAGAKLSRIAEALAS